MPPFGYLSQGPKPGTSSCQGRAGCRWRTTLKAEVPLLVSLLCTWEKPMGTGSSLGPSAQDLQLGRINLRTEDTVMHIQVLFSNLSHNTPFLSILLLNSESRLCFPKEGQEDKAAGRETSSVPPSLSLV